jgi:RNA polymerase sigma-70 factor, ECF subfamily
VTHIAIQQSAGTDTVVARAVAGDEDAFARLISEHNAAMARVAYVIAGDREAALDAVQSAWAIAWQRLGGLRDEAQVRAWLVAIAANEARQHRRRQRRATLVGLDNALGEVGSPDPSDMADAQDLGRVLQRLSPDDRRLLALRFVAGMESPEIARHMGLSASGVRSRLWRLVERLRSDLGIEQVDR